MMDPAAEVPTGYAERTVELVWRKARYVRNKNPEVWRADADDNLIHRWYYGVNDSSIGWVIDDTDRDDLKPRRVAGDGSGPRP